MTNTKKKLIPIFLVSFIILLLILIGLTIRVILYKNEPAKVFEIPNSTDFFESVDTDYISVSRSYIVSNPPTDVLEIKNLLIDYYKENKKIIESLDGYNTDRKYALYEIVFYKETWNFTRNWKPDLTYDDSDSEYVLDQLREHFKQCIGYLVFDTRNNDNTYVTILSDGYSQKNYQISPIQLE